MRPFAIRGDSVLVVHDDVREGRPALVFSERARRWGSVGAVGFVVVLVAVAALIGEGPADEAADRYLFVHAVAAGPFLVAGLLCTARALRSGAPQYRVFWQRWFAAGLTGVAATLAALAAVVLQEPAFLAADMALIAAGVPLWGSAVYHLAKARAGRWSVSIDVIDAATALVVLGLPAVLLVAEPVLRSGRLALASPFALTVVLMPAVMYLSLAGLARLPRGERSSHAIGTALAAAATVNATTQLAYVAGEVPVAFPVIVAVHATNMALLFVLPLWARRVPAAGRQDLTVRPRGLMPYVGAGVLPVVGIYLVVQGHNGSWRTVVFGAAVLVVVALNAVRYTAMSREARRLSAELAQLAEQRRHLLAGLLRGLDADHHRTAAELHGQALSSLASLSSIIRTAQATLPTDSAAHVRETVGQVQQDLSDRAEALRQLMVAIRAPAFGGQVPGGEQAGSDHTLTTALAAFTSELYPGPGAPTVQVRVDSELRLDWFTGTVLYRIAQEALLDAAGDPTVTAVRVEVSASGDGVLLRVDDDGSGSPRGTRAPAMELFAYLGRGEVVVGAVPGGGHVVRSRLGCRGDEANGERVSGARRTGHLRLIAGTDRRR